MKEKMENQNYLCFPKIKILEEIKIDEKTENPELRVQLKWQQADVININKRRYRKSLLEKVIENVQPLLKQGKVTGAGYHPVDGIGNVSDITHIWEQAEMLDSGECVGVAKILSTSNGKEIQTLIKAGVSLGVSSRGFGTVSEKTETIDGKETTFYDVNDDYQLRSLGDFVVAPSVHGAGVRKIIEEQLNKIDSLEENIVGKNDMKITNLKELKTELPELVKELEAEIKKSNDKTIKETVKKTIETEKENWKTEIVAEMEKTLIAPLKEQVEESNRVDREIITLISEKPGVVPLENEDEKNKDTKKDTEKDESEVKRLQKELDSEKDKVKTLEEEKKTKDEAEKKIAAETKLQKDLKVKVSEVFEKDEYKVYKALIEKRIVSEDGKITIESVDKVEEKIKAINDEISNLTVEAEKARIAATGLAEKGIVDDGDKNKLNEDKKKKTIQRQQFSEAVTGGYTGTFEEWKKITQKS